MYFQLIASLSLKLSVFVFGAIVFGSLLCLPLFGMSVRRLTTSTLWTKIIWWIPLYAVFSIILFGGLDASVFVYVATLVLAVREAVLNRAHRSRVALAYLILFALFGSAIVFAFLALQPFDAVVFLTTVTVMSVVSDITAFFLGNYGRFHHPLPAYLNPGKTWEGVAGQLIGSALGAVILAGLLGLPVPFWLVLLVGIASAAGDLFNSAAKRLLGIKDWGQTIPGHGGVLDRMSSLNAALGGALIAVLLTGWR